MIPVTVTPKAAKLEDIVFEYIVKHWPFAHIVVVVCVSALNKVVRMLDAFRKEDDSFLA